jgi:hypothetical protein
MERCPVCRASFRGGSSCHRCGADLSPLLAIDRQAEALERRAVQYLVAGDLDGAAAAAEQAVASRGAPLAVSLVGFTRQMLVQQGMAQAVPDGAEPPDEAMGEV